MLVSLTHTFLTLFCNLRTIIHHLHSFVVVFVVFQPAMMNSLRYLLASLRQHFVSECENNDELLFHIFNYLCLERKEKAHSHLNDVWLTNAIHSGKATFCIRN